MKRILYITAVVGCTFILGSCSKSAQSDVLLAPATTVVSASVSSNSTYELVLDKWQNVSISKQAAHSKSSVAEMDLKSGSMIYRYTPAMNFKGADEVVLTTKTAYTSNSSEGGGNCGGGTSDGHHESGSSSTVSYTSTSMTIKLTVTD